MCFIFTYPLYFGELLGTTLYFRRNRVVCEGTFAQDSILHPGWCYLHIGDESKKEQIQIHSLLVSRTPGTVRQVPNQALEVTIPSSQRGQVTSDQRRSLQVDTVQEVVSERTTRRHSDGQRSRHGHTVDDILPQGTRRTRRRTATYAPPEDNTASGREQQDEETVEQEGQQEHEQDQEQDQEQEQEQEHEQEQQEIEYIGIDDDSDE